MFAFKFIPEFEKIPLESQNNLQYVKTGKTKSDCLICSNSSKTTN